MESAIENKEGKDQLIEDSDIPQNHTNDSVENENPNITVEEENKDSQDQTRSVKDSTSNQIGDGPENQRNDGIEDQKSNTSGEDEDQKDVIKQQDKTVEDETEKQDTSQGPTDADEDEISNQNREVSAPENPVGDALDNKDADTSAEKQKQNLTEQEDGFRQEENESTNAEKEKQHDPTEGTDTTSISNIHLMHEDVRELLKIYVEEQGYNDVIINVEKGSDVGDGFMGFIGKVTVTGIKTNGEKVTFNWIIKTAPNSEMHRLMINVTNVYEREAYMYRNVFQIFKDFQTSKCILEPFDHYPKHILSYLENMKESIVMQDMKSLGYIMRPRHEPLDVNHVKLVMKAYAKFHAMSYAIKDQKPDVFKEIMENTKDIAVSALLTEGGAQMHAPMMAATINALDSIKGSKAQQMYQKYLDSYVTVVKELLEDINDRSVVGHGDSWVNNMLWKYDVAESNIPNKVCLLDWQQTRYGSPVCDLSYFMFTCTSKDFRDKYYDDMIRLYYYTLCGHVNELGSDPQKFLPFEALQEELKKYSLVGLFPTAMVLNIITRDTSEIPECRADDVTAEEMQEEWMKASRNANTYSERLTGVVIDFYEKGYFNSLK